MVFFTTHYPLGRGVKSGAKVVQNHVVVVVVVVVVVATVIVVVVVATVIVVVIVVVVVVVFPNAGLMLGETLAWRSPPGEPKVKSAYHLFSYHTVPYCTTLYHTVPY